MGVSVGAGKGGLDFGIFRIVSSISPPPPHLIINLNFLISLQGYLPIVTPDVIKASIVVREGELITLTVWEIKMIPLQTGRVWLPAQRRVHSGVQPPSPSRSTLPLWNCRDPSCRYWLSSWIMFP